MPSELRCPQGHEIFIKRLLHKWQGRIHTKPCGVCSQVIDRSAPRWKCKQDCAYDVCEQCWERSLRPAKAAAQNQPGRRVSFSSQPFGEEANGTCSQSKVAGINGDSHAHSQLREPLLGPAQEQRKVSASPKSALKPSKIPPPIAEHEPIIEEQERSYLSAIASLDLYRLTVLWLMLWLLSSLVILLLVERIRLTRDTQGHAIACSWLMLCIGDAGGAACLLVVKFLVKYMGWMTMGGEPAIPDPEKNPQRVQYSSTLVMAALAFLHALQIGSGDIGQYGVSVSFNLEMQMLTPGIALVVLMKLALGDQPSKTLMCAVAAVTMGGICSLGFGSDSVPWPSMLLDGILDRCITVAKWVCALLFMMSDASPPPMYLAMRTLATASVIGVEGTFLFQNGCFWTIFNLEEPGRVCSYLVILAFCSALQFVAELNTLRLTSVMLMSFLCPLKSILFQSAIHWQQFTVVQWTGIIFCALAAVIYARERPLPASSRNQGEVTSMHECTKTIIIPGDGKTFPKPGDNVGVKYSTYLDEDGSIVNEGLREFKIDKDFSGRKEVCRGWNAAVTKMTLGEKAELLIPPKYAGGDLERQALFGYVPPTADLRFKLHLLAVRDRNAAYCPQM